MNAQEITLFLCAQDAFKKKFRVIEILLFKCSLDGQKNNFSHFVQNTDSSLLKELKIKGGKIDFENEATKEEIILALASRINLILDREVTLEYYFLYLRDSLRTRRSSFSKKASTENGKIIRFRPN